MMGFAVLDSEGDVVRWSRWDDPTQPGAANPLQPGETMVVSDSLEAAQSQRQIDDEAARISYDSKTDQILALASATRQRNTLARMIELLRKRIDGGAWTAEESAEVEAAELLWLAIKHIREQ